MLRDFPEGGKRRHGRGMQEKKESILFSRHRHRVVSAVLAEDAARLDAVMEFSDLRVPARDTSRYARGESEEPEEPHPERDEDGRDGDVPKCLERFVEEMKDPCVGIVFLGRAIDEFHEKRTRETLGVVPLETVCPLHLAVLDIKKSLAFTKFIEIPRKGLRESHVLRAAF